MNQVIDRTKTSHRARRFILVTLQLTIACFLLSFATERPLRAYVDPGSGSLIWQTLVASLVGAIFYFRNFVSRLLPRRGARKPLAATHPILPVKPSKPSW
jgi:hypothetical protein